MAVIAATGVTILFLNPKARIYPAAAWIPVSLLYVVTASSMLAFGSEMPQEESKFWKFLAAFGFFTAAEMSGFGLVGSLMGSLAEFSSAGRPPPTGWFAAVAGVQLLTSGFVLYAVVLRARPFLPEPHQPRLASLDALSLGAAVFAVQAVAVVPSGRSVGLLVVPALLQLMVWSLAVSGALLNVLHHHDRYVLSSRWILLGCVSQSLATSIITRQILGAAALSQVGGTAGAALILALGAAAFGEALEADRRAGLIGRQPLGPYARLYPSLEEDAFEKLASSGGRFQALRTAAGPLLAVAGPMALAVALVVVLAVYRSANPVHRGILYAGFAVSLVAGVGRLALGRIFETEAAAKISTMLAGEKALVDEILLAVDRDRSAVATRIHDALVQPMTAAYLKLSHAKVMHERNNCEEAQRLLEEGISSLSEHIAEARSLVATVYPPALEHLGLTAALKELVAAYRRRGLSVDADLDWAGNVDSHVAVCIYRVANEALDNALQYSQPKRVRIRLRSVEDALELDVSDDGPGFYQRSEVEYIESGRLGIATMRRVAAMIGAGFDIDSEGRTIVKVSIPLAQRQRLGS